MFVRRLYRAGTGWCQHGPGRRPAQLVEPTVTMSTGARAAARGAGVVPLVLARQLELQLLPLRLHSSEDHQLHHLARAVAPDLDVVDVLLVVKAEREQGGVGPPAVGSRSRSGGGY